MTERIEGYDGRPIFRDSAGNEHRTPGQARESNERHADRFAAQAAPPVVSFRELPRPSSPTEEAPVRPDPRDGIDIPNLGWVVFLIVAAAPSVFAGILLDEKATYLRVLVTGWQGNVISGFVVLSMLVGVAVTASVQANFLCEDNDTTEWLGSARCVVSLLVVLGLAWLTLGIAPGLFRAGLLGPYPQTMAMLSVVGLPVLGGARTFWLTRSVPCLAPLSLALIAAVGGWIAWDEWRLGEAVARMLARMG